MMLCSRYSRNRNCSAQTMFGSIITCTTLKKEHNSTDLTSKQISAVVVYLPHPPPPPHTHTPPPPPPAPPPPPPPPYKLYHQFFCYLIANLVIICKIIKIKTKKYNNKNNKLPHHSYNMQQSK